MSTQLGALFAEQVHLRKKRRKITFIDSQADFKVSTIRMLFFVVVFIIVFAILLARLFVITIIQGEKYRKLASENRIRETKIIASRGIIYDRRGIALVRNIPVFTDSRGQIFFEERPAMESSQLLSETITREYIYGDILAHVVGYIGEIDQAELDAYQRSDEQEIRLLPGDIFGKMGVEKSYDSLLRGIDGRRLIEVDAYEKKVRVLGQIEPRFGKNLNLTLDATLQRIASGQLGSRVGAVIATEPSSGQVLILYSAPSFDPNKFVRGEDISSIFVDNQKPLFNRVVAGLYPPGSTFKIVTAIAALESGAINRETRFEDLGVLQVGQYSYGNWYFNQYGKKEGNLDLVGALRRSNDIYFYKAGELTGIDNLAWWARKIGLAAISGIDIEGEEAGIMPDPAWRKQEFSENWFLGNTYHVAIGQGDLLTTPLQVNNWTNVVANGGKLCRPHISKVQSSKFKVQSENCRDLGIKEETIDLVREGMKQACAPGGTGWPLFKFKVQSSKFKVDGVDFLEPEEGTRSAKSAETVLLEIPVACKTGTAEFGDPKGKTHAWFTVFAPVYNPQISVTVLVEADGEGSSVAAPIAKKILEEWFTK